MTDFRAKARQFFKALSPCAVEDYSEIVCTNFQRHFSRIFLRVPKIVAMYEPMPGEIDVTLLTDFFENKECECLFPDWEGVAPSEMHFGIESDEIDIVFVPGLVFGEQGERMGRGKGYYDHFLPKATRAVRVALTYDELLKPTLPQEKWDAQMDYVFTQTRMIDCKRKSS